MASCPTHGLNAEAHCDALNDLMFVMSQAERDLKYILDNESLRRASEALADVIAQLYEARKKYEKTECG